MKFTFLTASSKIPSGVAEIKIVAGKDFKVVEKASGGQVLTCGAGDPQSVSIRSFITLVRRIVATTKQNKIKKIYISVSDFSFPKLKKVGNGEAGSLIAQNMLLANFEFNHFKTKPSEGFQEVNEVFVVGASKAMESGIKRGIIIGEEINKCRVLANTPGGDMTPSVLTQRAREASKGLPIKVTIFDEKEMKKIGMGAVLGVGKGSPERPKFIILEYWGASKKKNPIVLVGKGVTFDTGGLSLKPADSMLEMHLDMSGGAAVIHTLTLAARLKLKKNVIALVPAVENMPGGESYRPGDILKSLSGKTIEILNTDAEGRVILADALTYAERYKPKLVVDVATLTGAALIALGQVASVILTKDEKIAKQFQDWGEESGEYVWPLPLWDEYEQFVQGNFADVANIPSKGNTRYGGVINGGMFLYQFAKKYPWIHIDMAPRMTAAEGDYLSKGATGAPIRLLLKVLEYL
jgi:leucyl aminopeptidase